MGEVNGRHMSHLQVVLKVGVKLGTINLYLFQLKVVRDFPLIVSEENQC